MKKFFLVLILIGFLFSGCVGSRIQYLSSEKYAAKPEGCELVVTELKYDEEKSTPIANFYTADKATESQAENELKKMACKLGADGVANVQYYRAVYTVKGVGTAFKEKEE